MKLKLMGTGTNGTAESPSRTPLAWGMGDAACMRLTGEWRLYAVNYVHPPPVPRIEFMVQIF